MVDEARRCLARLPNTGHSALLAQTAGEVAFAEGRLEDALDAFRHEEALAIRLGLCDMQLRAYTRIARTLAALGRTDAALQTAQSGLSLARLTHSGRTEVDSLVTLADLHGGLHSPPPPGSASSTARVHYLEQALHAAWPGSRFEPVTGLGHRRLLVDAGVIARSVAFVAERA